MRSAFLSRVVREKPFLLVLSFALLIFVSKAVLDGMALHENFALKDTDDIMRLMSVRDWLAGQGWFDSTQYRILPPEGMPLHWSRYLDVGIAAIILPLSLFMPMDLAEQVAVTIWPTLTFVISLLVVGFGTRRIFGVTAACFAVMCMVFWPVTGDLHSGAGKIDHHNIQMLMMSLVALALVWPDRPVLAGIVGGVAAAFSLTVGLESLPFVVSAGALALVKSIFQETPAARRFLVSFCSALGLGCVVMWLGQTAPAALLDPVCDRLGTPTLSLVGIAVAASLVPLVAGVYLRHPLARLGATILLTGIGIVIAWPLLSLCLGGPYAQLSQESQDLISTKIIEAKPIFVYVLDRPAATLVFVLPILVTAVFGVAFLRSSGETAPQDRGERYALGQLLILILVGAAMTFVQMRTVIIAAAVVPIVGGFVIARLFDLYVKGRDLKLGLSGLVVAVAIISPMLIGELLYPVMRSDRADVSEARNDCRSYASLVALNDVPPGLVLTHINFGPSLIWATHHYGLAAPYHRSAAAFANGIVPFARDEAGMQTYIRDTGATHLLLCRGYAYDSDFVTGLASGGAVDWLRPVVLTNDAQLLFEVLP